MTEKTLPKIARGTSRPGFRTSPATYTTPSQPSIVYTTACKLRRIAIINGQPEGSAVSEDDVVTDALDDIAFAWCPRAKHAATRTTNAAVFIAEVTSCVPLPQRMPRHCKIRNPRISATAICISWPARTGKRSRLYSAMTMETAAAVPQVDSQSLQPTMKPAYSPIARREKLYCPPLRGIDAPSSASEDAPKSAYIPPMTHMPMKSHALGSILAMSPGVRTMPAAMALPTATAMPNQTPSTCSSLPEPRDCGPGDALVLVEDSSDVLDNVESQECIGNSDIIMAMRQNASWKSVI